MHATGRIVHVRYNLETFEKNEINLMKTRLLIALIIFSLTACNMPASAPTSQPDSVTETFIPTDTFTAPPPTETFTPLPPTATETAIPTETPVPTVDELKATVNVDRLSCRYGPGANYLYLFAFVKGANIKLIGRAAGNNWVLVENSPQRCWINAQFVDIQGDPQMLRSMYPDGFKLIVSPYYGPTTVLNAKRDGSKVTVSWIEITIDRGDYESPTMFIYLVEVWRCENNEIVFETLGSTFPFISFTDETGCNEPSRGRVYVQEKHGYAGPADIPWPPHTTP